VDKKEATAKIAQLVADAKEKLAEATKISDESGVGFYYNQPGGFYSPVKPADAGADWESSDGSEDGWEHSSYC